MKLRDYQEELVNGVRQQIHAGHKRILMQLPCGGGKTACAGYILSRTVANGHRAMLAAHREELCQQASATMDKFSVPHGLIMSGEKMNLSKPMQVASILTLRNRLQKVPPPAVLVIDECQHLPSKTWREVAEHYAAQNTIIIGLSATPKRLSNESLKDHFDVMVKGPSIKELIAAGALSPYKYYAPAVGIDLTGITIRCGDYATKELELVTNKRQITGDVIQYYKKLIPGKRAIVFCVSVAHAQAVASQFTESGIPAECVDGNMPREARRGAMERFRRGETLALVNVEIAGEGVDIPAVEAVIMLRPTESLSLYLQQAGRALRPDRDNPFKTAYIIDHCGNVYRHDMPDTEHDWSLEAEIKKRRQSDGPTLSVKCCPSCYSVHAPARECPYCGWIYKVEPREVKMTPGELKELKEIERKKQRMEVGRCRTLEEIVAVAIARGYARGWCEFQCKAKHIPFSWPALNREWSRVKGAR
jgi:DNA repair protein RadD